MGQTDRRHLKLPVYLRMGLSIPQPYSAVDLVPPALLEPFPLSAKTPACLELSKVLKLVLSRGLTVAWPLDSLVPLAENHCSPSTNLPSSGREAVCLNMLEAQDSFTEAQGKRRAPHPHPRQQIQLFPWGQT